MKKLAAFILAGGDGKRLTPLTDHENKSALPFAGGFRLVDFSLINCGLAGVPRAMVLAQNRAEGLLSHVRTAPREVVGSTSIRPLTPGHDDLYLDPVDAIRKNLRFVDWTVENVLIMPGHQVFRMNFDRLLQQHRQADADVTVVLHPAPGSDGAVLWMDAQNRIRQVDEAGSIESRAGLRAVRASGFYLFRRDALSVLASPCSDRPPTSLDLEVLREAVRDLRVVGYDLAVHDPEAVGLWLEVTGIQSYWQANMDFLKAWPELSDGRAGITLPRAMTWVKEGFGGRVVNSLIPSSLERFDGEIRNSIVAPGVTLLGRCRVEDSILHPGAHIEDRCEARRAILDRDARLTGEARVDPHRMRPGSQIKTIGGITLVPRGVLVRGPARIPRPMASMPRPEPSRAGA